MRSRAFWGIAVLVAVVASATVVVLATAGGDSDRSIGSGVTVSGSPLRGDLSAKVVGGGRLPLISDVMQPVSEFFDIGPSGPVPAPMSVRLPLTQTVDASAQDYAVIVLTAATVDGPWAALPTTVAPNGQSVVATVSHLSILVAVRTWIGKAVGAVVDRAKSVLGAVKSVFDGLTADIFASAVATPPTCDREVEARAEIYAAGSDGKDALLWCFGLEDDQRVLKLVNNRRYVLLADHPGFTVIDAGPTFELRLAQLARAISGQGTVIFPGESAVLGVELPEVGGTATVVTRMDGFAQSLYALEMGLRTAATLLTQFGAGTGVAANGAIVGAMPIVDILDRALQYADCFAAVTGSDHNLGRLVAACFNADNLLSVFGRGAVFLAPLMVVAPVINYLHSQLNALGDQLNGRDSQRVWVTRANVSAACPAGPASCYGIRQVDIDGDGELDTVSLFFDEGFHTRVVFSTGETSEGSFGFATHRWDHEGHIHDITPEEAQFSFLGFADMYREGTLQIFGLAEIDGSWHVMPLRFTGKGDRLIRPSFDGLTFDFSLGINEPFGIISLADHGYGGFRCAVGSAGQAQLVVWKVTTWDEGSSRAEYRFQQITFELENRVWDQNGALYVEEAVPMVDPEAARQRARAERAKGSCEGLDPLPPI